MAQLVHMRIISIEDLEESLGVSRFRDFIWHSEERFQKQLAKVVRRVTEDLAIQAVFVSGPTSSGKNDLQPPPGRGGSCKWTTGPGCLSG